VAPGDSFQLPLDDPRTGEQAPVHLIEAVIGCVKHEAARDTDGDPDRAAIELDGKSLRNHGDSTPDAQQWAWMPLRIQAWAARLD